MPRAQGVSLARAGPMLGTRQYTAHVAVGAMSGKSGEKSLFIEAYLT